MQPSTPDHYAVLGLERDATPGQIRDAYRILAKQHHPDLLPGSDAAMSRIREINAAYEALGDEARKLAYDRESARVRKTPSSSGVGKKDLNVAKEAHLSFEEFVHGATLEVRVDDPANPGAPEIYTLDMPPGTAPGARFRVRREGIFQGGQVIVRVLARPDFRFKARGPDLRCDLRITTQRAAQGGEQMLAGLGGSRVRLIIPARVARGTVLKIPGEGLPRTRGGRGDLLVRILYNPEVTIRRKTGR